MRHGPCAFEPPCPVGEFLGRFAAKSVFVGLSLFDSHTLNGNRTYAGYAQAMIDKWEEDLPGIEQVRGLTWQDYLNGTAKDVYGNTELPA